MRVEVATVPDGFVAGEETALLQALPAAPRSRPSSRPIPSSAGSTERPTLVQNVETLAHLALIARFGAAWFRSVGHAG